MTKKCSPLWSFVAFIGLLGFFTACAATKSGVNVISLESPHPELSSLTMLGGDDFSIADEVPKNDATVLVWWATGCPCVRRYEDRILGLRAAFDNDRVSVFAIASNADDSAESLRDVSRARGFDVPIVVDRGGRLADLLGVRTTPTTVVLASDGRVVYRGWIDNERAPGVVERIPFVDQAVRALLDPNTGDAQKTSPIYGCRITRSLRSSGRDPQACQ